MLIPQSEIDNYFVLSDSGLCPDELSTEFSMMQSYLIQNNLQMMGPLFYLRTATMIKYDKMSCDQAIAKNSEIEREMLGWIAKSAELIRSIPSPVKE